MHVFFLPEMPQIPAMKFNDMIPILLEYDDWFLTSYFCDHGSQKSRKPKDIAFFL